jgi:hypothetical protein
MAKIRAELPDRFWTSPAVSKVRCVRSHVRDIFLRHGKYLMVEGHLWTIKAEHLGAGAYEITLVEGGGK